METIKLDINLYNDLKDFLQYKYEEGKVLKYNGFYSIEDDIKKSFNLKNDFIYETFRIMAEGAASYRDTPLRCYWSIEKESIETIFHHYDNLQTGEKVNTDTLLLRNAKISNNDKFEFWVIWLVNPDKNEYKKKHLLPIVTRPLDLDYHLKVKNDKKIKLDL